MTIVGEFRTSTRYPLPFRYLRRNVSVAPSFKSPGDRDRRGSRRTEGDGQVGDESPFEHLEPRSVWPAERNKQYHVKRPK